MSPSEQIVFVDIETSDDGKIYGLGAIFGQRQPIRAYNARGVAAVLPELRRWIREAAYVCGHNSLLHDFPLLENTELGRIPEEKRLDTLLLSPLAFPKKPYHALVKEGKLVTFSRNDPLADSQCCANVLDECAEQLAKLPPRDLDLYVRAFSRSKLSGLAAWLGKRDLASPASSAAEAETLPGDDFLVAFRSLNATRCCLNKLPRIEEPEDYLAYAYIHAWLNVAGGDSVLPYWICHRFPQIRGYLHTIRAVHCGQPDCVYCSDMHSPTKALERYFGFPAFRPEPCVPGQPGQSLQERIVATAMQGRSSLSILPTGGGKSICFQIPALRRYECTGALSIVISPLQSLMKDQVENLRNRVGILHCNALYGMLTPLERKACLHDISHGSVGLIYVAPEQLRNSAFRTAIANREIAYWIFDEAHCLSHWGHDFRPDYLYAAKFIKRLAEDQGLDCPAIMALTATAKQDVKDDIRAHFKTELGVDMVLNDGGTHRKNLNYSIESVSPSAKLQRIVEILSAYYGEVPDYEGKGSVVIFTATRSAAEEYAENLCLKQWKAKAFHAGLKVEDKREILEGFLSGSFKIIVSTNAFGMGVDKPDIRYVIHVDAPGSLESYLQEAGRAGRDGEKAECILLFNEADLETQHSFVAWSKITQKDIQIIWRAIRNAKADPNGAIVLTVDEILSNKQSYGISFEEHDRATKTKTAIALLEKQDFLERRENRSRVFQARALVKDTETARQRIQQLKLPLDQVRLWMAVMDQFFDLPDNACSEISAFSQLEEMQREFERVQRRDPRIQSINTVVFRVLNEMARPEAALLKKDLLFSAFLHAGNQSSARKLQLLCQLESAMLDLMRSEEPSPEGACDLHLLRMNEALCRQGLLSHADTLARIIKFLQDDWSKLESGVPGLEASQRVAHRIRIVLRSDWDAVRRLSELRRNLAALILQVLLSKPEAKGDALVSFSESELIDHVRSDLSGIAQQIKNLPEALHHALLWLHDSKVIELQGGKALVTSAMTLYLKDHKKGRQARRFTKGDYAPLAAHFMEKVFQVHIIGEYASKGIKELGTHLHFVREYFRLEGDRFIKQFFSGKEKYLRYATGIESYRKIYESLGNPKQQAIVAADQQANLLSLAGPGSGKTRVIVHRCAWLLRVERVNPRGIVILCFNRFAALDLRRRLWKLVGKDAFGVTVQTYHGLALRILGRTMADLDESGRDGKLSFEQIIPEANRLLKSEEVPIGMEADEFRERLVGNLTHILVDEYQDIGPEAYELVSLIAGKTKEAKEDKLSLMAVGDDDQSIYGFAGANVEFIRRFEADYATPSGKGGNESEPIERHYLVENYRSTPNIIAASNRLISLNRDRMKTEYPIQPSRNRRKERPGGALEATDPLARGMVQILDTDDRIHQAEACVAELLRLKALLPDAHWADFCIFARTNQALTLVRLLLERQQVPAAVIGQESMPRLRRVRPIHCWIKRLRASRDAFWDGARLQAELKAFLASYASDDPHAQLLENIRSSYYAENGGSEQRVADIELFFCDLLAERDRSALLEGVRLSTAHKAKGLEFDHVLMLDGAWNPRTHSRREIEEERRIFYVAMTRAKKSLAIFRLQGSNNRFIEELVGPETLHRRIETERSAQDLIDIQSATLSLDELWIDYAGSKSLSKQVSHAIEGLQRKELLHFREYQTSDGKRRMELLNAQGIAVARLSVKGVETWSAASREVLKIQLLGVHIRRSDDGETRNDGGPELKEEWGIPICEVYFRPLPTATSASPAPTKPT